MSFNGLLTGAIGLTTAAYVGYEAYDKGKKNTDAVLSSYPTLVKNNSNNSNKNINVIAAEKLSETEYNIKRVNQLNSGFIKGVYEKIVENIIPLTLSLVAIAARKNFLGRLAVVGLLLNIAYSYLTNKFPLLNSNNTSIPNYSINNNVPLASQSLYYNPSAFSGDVYVPSPISPYYATGQPTPPYMSYFR